MPWWWGYTETVSPRPPRLHRISTPQAAYQKIRCGTAYADAILDRIVHNAHRIELDGETIRKNRARAGKKE